MKLFASIAFFVICALSHATLAGQAVISDDGREVQLNKDGSWSYISTDRYATTADGKRVRLRKDGSWEFTGEKALAVSPKVMAEQKFVEARSLEVTLAELTIETYRGRRSESHKSSSKKTNSVFTINFAVEKKATEAVELTLSKEQLAVEDSTGREYTIIGFEPDSVIINPGQEASLVLRVDGSPHWWTTKTMSVSIDQTALSSNKDIVLTYSMSDAKNKAVDSL